MIVRNKISRRTLLRGAGGLSLGLPWLEAMTTGTARAATATPIKRLIFFFTPGGQIFDKWRPTGTETNFTLPSILDPLLPFQKNLLVIDGLDSLPMVDGVGQQHQRGMGALLTGRALPAGSFGFFDSPAGFPQGMSVDQVIGAKIGATTKYKTLEFGVLWPTYGGGPLPQNILSYTASQQPAPPMRDPYDAFTRLFSDIGLDAAGTTAASARSKKTRMVLDAANAEFTNLNKTASLSMDDRRRLDEHLAQIKTIATGLDAVGPLPMGGACAKPMVTQADKLDKFTTGDGGSHYTLDISDKLPAVGKLMTDMLVMAMACDLTRVATLQWTDAASRASFPFLNLPQNHHFYQHDGGFQSAECATINRWFTQQFAYLLTKLQSTPEGDHTILDSTAVVYITEIAVPPTHDYRGVPFLIAGNAGGSFKTGRYVKYDHKPHSNLLVSLQNAYWIDSNTFGDPKYCTGALTGLT